MPLRSTAGRRDSTGNQGTASSAERRLPVVNEVDLGIDAEMVTGCTYACVGSEVHTGIDAGIDAVNIRYADAFVPATGMLRTRVFHKPGFALA